MAVDQNEMYNLILMYILNITWARRLTNKDDSNWKVIPSVYFKTYGGIRMIFQMNVRSSRLLPKCGIPDFYKNLLNSWLKLTNKNKPNNEYTYSKIKREMFWGNEEIQINRKVLIFES